jgi:RNA polymerase sigma-70 factor (ECF subfamily)
LTEPSRIRERITPPPPEELERVRARDSDALGRFFDRYFGFVHGIAARMTGDGSLAEDVTQEVFLKVHRAIDRLDPTRDPAPWLTTITCNACREHWRGRHHRAGLRSRSIDEIEDWDRDHPRDSGDPEAEYGRKQKRRRIEAALGRLPEKLREVVILRDWQGLDHREIAEALGASHAAVRKRYSRALAALAEDLGGLPE